MEEDQMADGHTRPHHLRSPYSKRERHCLEARFKVPHHHRTGSQVCSLPWPKIPNNLEMLRITIDKSDGTISESSSSFFIIISKEHA